MSREALPNEAMSMSVRSALRGNRGRR